MLLVSSPKQAVQREKRYWKILYFLHNPGNGLKMYRKMNKVGYSCMDISLQQNHQMQQ